MIEKLEGDLTEVHNNVLSMMFKAQQSLQRLDEIALKPNVPVNLTICEDLLKVPKTHNRYLSGFLGGARHREKTWQAGVCDVNRFLLSTRGAFVPQRLSRSRVLAHWPSCGRL